VTRGSIDYSASWWIAQFSIGVRCSVFNRRRHSTWLCSSPSTDDHGRVTASLERGLPTVDRLRLANGLCRYVELANLPVRYWVHTYHGTTGNGVLWRRQAMSESPVGQAVSSRH
jgi:hypothetical protein